MTVMSTFFSRIRHVLIPLQNGFETVDEAHAETGIFDSPEEIPAFHNAEQLRLGAFWIGILWALKICSGLNLPPIMECCI